MKILFVKYHPEAEVPYRASAGAAGYDAVATDMKIDTETNTVTYCLGLAVSIPKGTYLDARARSSICKVEWMLTNGAGVIDSDYRGLLKFIYRPVNPVIDVRNEQPFKIGERVGQLLLLKHQVQNYEAVLELDETDRGPDGWGSTGR